MVRTTAAGLLHMGRKKRDDTTVKISTAVYKKAKMVASYRGIPLAELLSDLLEKPVEREYQKVKESMSTDTDKGGKE